MSIDRVYEVLSILESMEKRLAKIEQILMHAFTTIDSTTNADFDEAYRNWAKFTKQRTPMGLVCYCPKCSPQSEQQALVTNGDTSKFSSGYSSGKEYK